MVINIGDRFTLKNSRDSIVYEVRKIHCTSNIEPTYQLKPIGLGTSNIYISESSLLNLYTKL